MPLDTDGRTQDNSCLLFMEGPSATLHAFFIWRLLKGQSQEPLGKGKLNSLYLMCMCKIVHVYERERMNAFVFACRVEMYMYCTILGTIILL